MFPRQNRLSREELSKVLKNGCQVYSALFTLKILDVGGSHFKSAFVISKKELKLAVDRNRAKRIARTALRSIISHIPNVSFVVLLKKSVISTDLGVITKEFETSFKSKGFYI